MPPHDDHQQDHADNQRGVGDVEQPGIHLVIATGPGPSERQRHLGEQPEHVAHGAEAEPIVQIAHGPGEDQPQRQVQGVRPDPAAVEHSHDHRRGDHADQHKHAPAALAQAKHRPRVGRQFQCQQLRDKDDLVVRRDRIGVGGVLTRQQHRCAGDVLERKPLGRQVNHKHGQRQGHKQGNRPRMAAG